MLGSTWAPLPTTSTWPGRLHCFYILLLALGSILATFSSTLPVFSAWHCVFHAPAFRCHWEIFATLEAGTCAGSRAWNFSTSSFFPVAFSHLGSVLSLLTCPTAVVLCALTSRRGTKLNSDVAQEISSEGTLNHEMLDKGEISLHTLFCSLLH